MSSVYARNLQQIRKNCTAMHFVVQRFILKVCNNHVQQLAFAVFVNSKGIGVHIFMQHIYILMIPLYEIALYTLKHVIFPL